MEHWIVYDLATGEERWRGSGPAGNAALQQLPEHLAMVTVPQAAIEGQTLDLDVFRVAVCEAIDGQAELVRSRFITATPGQIGTYVLKEAAARAWLADNGASTLMLAPEAQARGKSVADLVAEVVARADAWSAVSGQIEALRMGAKGAVASAATIGAVVSAARVDWTAIDAPPA